MINGNDELRNIDILEDEIYNIHPSLLRILLKDKTTRKNILWGTTDYLLSYGSGFEENSEMLIQCVTGMFDKVIQPRALKPREIREKRIKNKAEVFTPSWICNEQNNLVDDAWFGRKNVFNTSDGRSWITTSEKIDFSNTEKTWEQYVDARRLEITCGEAPYLVSRYDTTTGQWLPVFSRIGVLDRKLRVVSDNCETDADWDKWALRAMHSVYGYEFQGDSVLIARENLLYTYVDFYLQRYGQKPSLDRMKEIANVIAWNIWQMDGFSCTVPYSCHDEKIDSQYGMFNDADKLARCPGCEKNNLLLHNGVYCKIKDWRDKSTILFVSVVNGGRI